MPYTEFLKTDYWKKLAKKCKDKAGKRCQLCDSPKALIAHHRSYEFRGEGNLELDDLTCICKKCHAKFHRINAKDELRKIYHGLVEEYNLREGIENDREIDHFVRIVAIEEFLEKHF